MDGSAFDTLSRLVATAGTRRRLLALLSAFPLAGSLLSPDTTAAKPARKHRRHHRQTKRQRRTPGRDHASSEACIPTGQTCPSRKPRGKKGKKLSCNKCCQGSFITEASGKKVCGCQPNGGPCTSETASSCCSGFCNGSTCAAAPCSAANPCPPCQSCDATTGLCQAVANGATCDDGNPCTLNDTCQSGTCVSGAALPNGTACGSGQLCCGGGCVSGTCCSNAGCAGTPTTPICGPARTCVACTSSSQCPSGQICLADGSCHTCNVTCPTGSTPAACGTALQTALDPAGPATIYVCAGTYQGNFTINRAVTVIGAGQEEAPAANTVLDGGGAGRVVFIQSGAGVVTLERLHVMGGRVTEAPGVFGGGGLRVDAPNAVLRDCTFAGNEVIAADIGSLAGGGIQVRAANTNLIRCTIRDNHATSGNGGGLSNPNGTMTLTDCLVVDNTADNVGGGIWARTVATTLAGRTEVRGNSAFGGGGIWLNEGTLTIGADCRVTHNTGSPGNGGGIKRNAGTAILQGAHPEQIVVDNCHENCVGVPGCTETQISCP